MVYTTGIYIFLQYMPMHLQDACKYAYRLLKNSAGAWPVHYIYLAYEWSVPFNFIWRCVAVDIESFLRVLKAADLIYHFHFSMKHLFAFALLETAPGLQWHRDVLPSALHICFPHPSGDVRNTFLWQTQVWNLWARRALIRNCFSTLWISKGPLSHFLIRNPNTPHLLAL